MARGEQKARLRLLLLPPRSRGPCSTVAEARATVGPVSGRSRQADHLKWKRAVFAGNPSASASRNSRHVPAHDFSVFHTYT